MKQRLSALKKIEALVCEVIPDHIVVRIVEAPDRLYSIETRLYLDGMMYAYKVVHGATTRRSAWSVGAEWLHVVWAELSKRGLVEDTTCTSSSKHQQN